MLYPFLVYYISQMNKSIEFHSQAIQSPCVSPATVNINLSFTIYTMKKVTFSRMTNEKRKGGFGQEKRYVQNFAVSGAVRGSCPLKKRTEGPRLVRGVCQALLLAAGPSPLPSVPQKPGGQWLLQTSPCLPSQKNDVL